MVGNTYIVRFLYSLPMNNKSKKSYSVSSKIEAVKRISTGESVTVIARELGVARKTLYIWSKRYSSSANRNKPQSLDSRYVSGNNHHKSVSKSLRFKLLTLVVKHPSWSLNQYADALKMGRHGIYNALRRFDLTTVDGRLAFSNLYYGPGKLETDIKVSIIRSIERGDVSIAEIAREYHISRKTIYRWIKQYQDSHDLTPCYVKGQDHHKSFASKDVDTILGMVRKYPESSIHELARLTDYSSHGIYNVLSRYNLTTADKRRAYAVPDGAVQPRRAPLVDRVKTVYEQFTPQKAPAPPPVFQLLKTFFISAGASFVTFLSLGYWIDLILTAPSLSFGIGIVFAGISLMMGTLFFLYSFKYYITLAIVLSYSQSKEDNNSSTEGGFLQRLFGYGAQPQNKLNTKAIGLESNLDHIHLSRHPYISVQIPFFNEKYVAERAIIAATNFDYDGEYEVMVCDDSTDETTEIIRNYLRKNCIHGAKAVNIRKEEGWELYSAEVKPGVTLKHLHRTSRSGFKGAALKLALTLVDERTEFISIFDADFVPYPDSLELFLKYFKAQNDGKETYENSNVAVVQGYQWHVLNKSENWITRGVRSEYSGSYVIERSGQEVYGGLKHISGSVYMIRKDVLEKVGWASSITEDYELTLKLYEAGYKVVYTPYIQAPAECVSTLKRLIRQRMRWAEGHSYNVKLMWKRLLWGRWEVSKDMDSLMQGSTVKNNETMNQSNNEPIFVPSPLTFAEKMEFMFNIPYYLQAFFFLVGTLAWLLSEAIFPAQLPFWTSLWGWSLVLTNMFALPLVNAVGLFLEESEERDYSGLASFVILSYLVVPFQAYAAMKGFLEKEEGGWFRTPKTGVITDVFKRGTFYRFIEGILPNWSAEQHSKTSTLQSTMESYLSRTSANDTFNDFKMPSVSKRRLLLGKVLITTFVVMFVGVNYLGTLAPVKEVSVNPPTAHRIQTVKTDYSLTESPEFMVIMPQSHRNKKLGSLIKEVNAAENELETKVYYQEKEIDIPIVQERLANGNYKITVQSGNHLQPGKYSLVTTMGGVSKSEVQTQSFTWGVLALNFNKSSYKAGDEIVIGMGVVDDSGDTVCDASITVSISSTSGEESYSDDDIKNSDECGATTVTANPDYSLTIPSLESGTYTVTVTARTRNGERTVVDYFEVHDSLPFDIVRNSATRIFPPVDYSMNISVTPDTDFQGRITERVPASFIIEGASVSETTVDDKILAWDVNWKAGTTYTLSYTYKAPDISPEFYLLGPLEFYTNDTIIYSETRSWQVAADAVAHDATTDGGSTSSFSHTVSGTDRVLLVFVNFFSTTDPDVTSLTYNGVALSKVTDSLNNWTANRYLETQVWSLANPDTGTHTVSLSASGSIVASSVVASSYNGIDTADPIDAVATNTGSSSNPSVDITTQNANSLIVGGGLVAGGDTDPFTPGTNTTELWDNATGTGQGDIGYFGGTETASTVGTYTFDFNSSASDRWSIIAVEVVVPEKLLLFMFLVPLVPYYFKRKQ